MICKTYIDSYMLFRVCHASMMQACNNILKKPHCWKLSLQYERVLYWRGVIKRMGYTIIPWN